MRKIVILFGVLGVVSCAQTSEKAMRESVHSNLTCEELVNKKSESLKTLELATEQKKDSWKVILPFIVVANYYQASAIETETQDTLSVINKFQIEKGCYQS